MFLSIFIKEWVKLKWIFIVLLFAEIIILSYFALTLNFAFSNIEPESMMWYQLIQLEQKPYFNFSYFYLIIGIVVALAQFSLEVIEKRIKVTVHLPLEMKEIVFYHLLMGIAFVVVLNSIFSIALLNIIIRYYPSDVLVIAFKDVIAYSFASVVSYIITASVIVEKNKKQQFLKALWVGLFIFLFIKERYTSVDLLWCFFLFFVPFLLLDSFYSIKQQNLGKVFQTIVASVTLILLGLTYFYYINNYKKEFNQYYIFHSDILNDFVYQKNFGDHQFEYGIKNKKTMTHKEYQGALPFVYWKDLDIQNKLPIEMNGILFDKQTIKDSRLGFSYEPEKLKALEIALFPLFNPQSHEGIILFPEEFFGIYEKKVKIYHYDQPPIPLQKNLNEHFLNAHFAFPAKKIWGKPTNIKPYDLGYLILDTQNSLFHLKREDNLFSLQKIEYPDNIEITHIHISENKQKLLSGYAIDSHSNFYLLDWDFKFIKLELKSFNHQTMKLKLIADPLHYLIRYDDGKTYYAELYSKQTYQKIKETVFDNY